jgi:hypothetical protein
MLADTSKWMLGYGYFPGGNLKIDGAGAWNLSWPIVAAGVLRAGWKSWRERGPAHRWRRVLLPVLLSAVVGHIFYDKQHGRFGERRFFEVLPLFCLFTAELFLDLLSRLRALYRIPVLVLLAAPAVAFVGPRTLDSVRVNNQERLGLFLECEKRGLVDALVFVRDGPFFHARYFARNDPFLRGNVFVIADHHETTAADERVVRALFAGRAAYVYDFDAATQRYALTAYTPRPAGRR